MDIDMHYYGTYALARAAGLRQDVAFRIATAAEFVDDSTKTEVLVHPDGARFRGEATAHHPTALSAINDLDNQQLVWVPFHFLPGGIGETQSQKLRCAKNSAVALKMVDRHLADAEKAHGVELMGITAHVYADTFAHYGFSGVSSRVNRLEPGTLKAINGDPMKMSDLLTRFFEKYDKQGTFLPNFRNRIASKFGQELSGALGHGAAATFPDQPFLEWMYDYELPGLVGQQRMERQNARDYEQGAEALHAMFRRFADLMPLYADSAGGRDFEDIRATVRTIVALPHARDVRTAAWRQALVDGKISRKLGDGVPDYSHDDWRQQTANLVNLPEPQAATQIPVYHFHFAAAVHRHFVLRELLPDHGIYII